MIEGTAHAAAAFNANSAFFGAFGAEGWEVLRAVITAVPPDIPVMMDAKRGTKALWAEAYRRGVFEAPGARGVTASPYFGRD